MLVDFSVRNFGPFRDRAVLSMEPAAISDGMYAIRDTPAIRGGLLKAAAVFGPNASGKSFLFDALGSLRNIIGELRPEGGEVPGYIPFALSEDALKEPVSLGMRLVIDGVLYDYSLSYDDVSIVSESLYHSPNGRRALVFRRGIEERNIDPDVMAHLTASTPYLFVAAGLNDALCNRVLQAIMSISIVYPGHRQDVIRSFNLSQKDPEVKRMMLSALDAADLGINDFTGTFVPKSDSAVKEMHNMADIRMVHGFGDVGDQAFPIGMESDGTVEMFSIMGPVGMALKNGGTVLIDGFGSELHPLLTRWLVGLFNSEANTNGAQLIVNTHDIALLDIRELFRRDQIWFVNKDRTSGASALYSLSQVKGVRKGSEIRGDYLMGRFDAVPSVVRVQKL